MNKCWLMGRITADPELRKTESGLSVVNFTLAVSRPGNHEDKKADFIFCVAWRGTAEFICKYFQKGSPIVIEGSIRSHIWEKDGQRTQSLEVMVDEVEFVLRSKDASAGSTTEAQNTVPFERGNSSYQAPKEVYAVTQSFAQGNDDDFQQVEMDEDLPF